MAVLLMMEAQTAREDGKNLLTFQGFYHVAPGTAHHGGGLQQGDDRAVLSQERLLVLFVSAQDGVFCAARSTGRSSMRSSALGRSATSALPKAHCRCARTLRYRPTWLR